MAKSLPTPGLNLRKTLTSWWTPGIRLTRRSDDEWPQAAGRAVSGNAGCTWVHGGKLPLCVSVVMGEVSLPLINHEMWVNSALGWLSSRMGAKVVGRGRCPRSLIITDTSDQQGQVWCGHVAWPCSGAKRWNADWQTFHKTHGKIQHFTDESWLIDSVVESNLSYL